jgi:GDP/UDP-N,N'-diacetylbacillosamine 2-epimerase (hydrolysing)
MAHAGISDIVPTVRRIFYVTGTRADFGLMASTLQCIADHPELELQIAVTGMHLSATFGSTVREIEATGLPIVARIPTNVEARTALSMAEGIGEAVVGLSRALVQARPDLVLLIGDRGEMLAGAIAALHLGIPIVHLHGGERSGTIDEPVRHAITKLSHLHFVATEQARERVIRMGERPEHVWVTGAPSLDGLDALAAFPREMVLADLGLPVDSRYVLVLFHPVVQEFAGLREQTRQLAQALQEVAAPAGLRTIWLDPNADAGSGEIVEAILHGAPGLQVHRVTHLPRPRFIAALRYAQVLVGNSSAGIIESASLGTPVVNIGSRQRARERNENTIDCEPTRGAIAAAVAQALAHGQYPARNWYGDDHAGPRIAQLLATAPLSPGLLDKLNAY